MRKEIPVTDLPSTEPNAVAGPAIPRARLVARDMTTAHERHMVSHNLDIDIPVDVFTATVGSNACGKSTLLRALAQLHRPVRGTALLDDTDIAHLDTREVACRVGLLPQSATVPDGMLVHDLVARGRFPYQGLFRQWSQQDRQAVEGAMEMVGVTELAAYPIDELSGGQHQCVWVALVLAQDTETILLNEPTTSLDLAHQVGILQLCRRLNADGRTVVTVLHDLNQAAHCTEHMIVIHEDRVCTAGSPREILTEDLIEEVFGLVVVIVLGPVAGTPMVVPRHPGAVMPVGPDPAGTRSAPTDSIGGPASQPSANPALTGIDLTARSQQDK